MFKAIFWDNDGVLVDTERLYYQANLEVLRTQRYELTPEIFRQHWLKEAKGILIIAQQHGWSESLVKELREKRDFIYEQLLLSSELTFPETQSTLAALPKHLLQAVVTSSQKSHFHIIHKRTGLLPYFRFTLTQGDYKNSKPAPDPYLKALEVSKFKPNECLVVEDSERGLKSAKSAGLKCAIIRNELSNGSDFSKADYLLNSIREVLALF